jgi:hypothetical protein
MCLFSVLPKPQDMGENAEAAYLEKVKDHIYHHVNKGRKITQSNTIVF